MRLTHPHPLVLAGALALVTAGACAQSVTTETNPPIEPAEPIEPVVDEPFGPGLLIEDAPSDDTADKPGADDGPALRIHDDWLDEPLEDAVSRGVDWLVSKQGRDGGWGQDGGSDGDQRDGVSLEHSGNDVANTAMVAMALVRTGSTPRSGPHKEALTRATGFILAHIEKAPAEGLAVTSKQGTQIQRKLGQYVDTFMATMLLTQIEDEIDDEKLAGRVDAALDKCIAKIEANQQQDGSWNTDGWAPVISTSLASKSLYAAKQQGRDVDDEKLAKVDGFSRENIGGAQSGGGVGPATSVGGRPMGGGGGFGGMSGSAGVALYGVAQAVEQLSRTKESRRENKKELARAVAQLGEADFVAGFGSMGGEEFMSYMNVSESLSRTGGEPWTKWNGNIKGRLEKLQNKDGTWAGHHCITGRVACTAGAVLTLLTERTVAKK